GSAVHGARRGGDAGADDGAAADVRDRRAARLPDRHAVVVRLAGLRHRRHRERAGGGRRRPEHDHARGQGVHLRTAQGAPAGGQRPMTVHPRALDYADSLMHGPIPDESELTAGAKVEEGEEYGFFTDTSLCIGCKACEVACKEWNALPADDIGLTGHSYDNTSGLSATTWRHVAFIEKLGLRDDGDGRATQMQPFQSNWLMASDVC